MKKIAFLFLFGIFLVFSINVNAARIEMMTHTGEKVDDLSQEGLPIDRWGGATLASGTLGNARVLVIIFTLIYMLLIHIQLFQILRLEYIIVLL